MTEQDKTGGNTDPQQTAPQDQVFGVKAEERRRQAEEAPDAVRDDSRPAEPHAGGKA